MKVTFKKWTKLLSYNDVLLQVFVNTGDPKTYIAFNGYVSENQIHKFKKYIKFNKLDNVERENGTIDRTKNSRKYVDWCKTRDVKVFSTFEMFYGIFKMKVKEEIKDNV